MRKLTTAIGLVLILAVGLAGVGRPQPARAATGDNVVLQWNEVTLQAIRDTRPLPTVAARALAVVHTAIYDAWAAYAALVDLFPTQTQQEAFTKQMGSLGYASDGSDASTAAWVGATAAQKVL